MITLDNLRRQTVAEWTAPTSVESQVRIRVIRELTDLLEEPAPDSETFEGTEKEFKALMKTRKEAPATIKRLTKALGDDRYTLQIRVVLATYNGIADARYKTLRTEATVYFEELTGVSINDFEIDEDTPEARERLDLVNHLLAWAAAIPAIQNIETRQIDLIEAGNDISYDGEGWQIEEIPKAWLSVESGLEALPTPFLTAMAGEARTLNTEIFAPLAEAPIPSLNGTGADG